MSVDTAPRFSDQTIPIYGRYRGISNLDTSDAIYDQACRFGLQLLAHEPETICEDFFNGLLISVPLSDLAANVTWKNANGSFSHAVARQGDAIVTVPERAQSIACHHSGRFLSLQLDADQPSPDTIRFLVDRVWASDRRVIVDHFLYVLSFNLVSLFLRGKPFDSSFMAALRTIVVGHITTGWFDDPVVFKAIHNGLGTTHLSPVSSIVVDRQSSLPARPLDNRRTPPAKNGKKRRLPSARLAPWQLNKVFAFVRCDLQQDRSIEELAGLIGLSKGHFSRAFLGSTGLSPHQWITEERVKLAMHKLTETEDPISEIASRCGFGRQSHFTRTFTRTVGVSPAKWRRENKA